MTGMSDQVTDDSSLLDHNVYPWLLRQVDIPSTKCLSSAADANEQINLVFSDGMSNGY